MPAAELTADDFVRHAVWQFALDDQAYPAGDESWVAPACDGFGGGRHASFMAGAHFRLANGETLPGAVQVDVLGARVYFTPAMLFAADRTVDPMAPDVTARLQRLLQQPAARPVAWALDVALDGEAHVRRGRIARTAWWRAWGLLWRLVALRLTPRGPRR